MNNNLIMNVVEVKGLERKDLCNALLELAKIDDDFNGRNGIEHLWGSVNPEKYNSNAEYLIDVLKDKKTDKEIIEEFIRLWINYDNYYLKHKLNIMYENNKAKIISLPVFCEC